MLRKAAVQEYFFFYLLVFSQLFGVHLGSELGIDGDSSSPKKLLSDAQYVNAFDADLQTKTLYYYHTKEKVIYSQPLEGGQRTEEFSYNLEGLYRIQFDGRDNNLYLGINKKNLGSFIVVCSLHKSKKERKCSTIVEEKQIITSFLYVDRKFALLVNNLEKQQQEVKICDGDCKSIVKLDKDEEFVGDITYDYNKHTVIWTTSESNFGFYKLKNEVTLRRKATKKDFKVDSLAFFNGEIFVGERETGQCYRFDIHNNYKKVDNLRIGTVSAMMTSYYDKDDYESFCNDEKCATSICVSTTKTSRCICPVNGKSRNCANFNDVEVAIGVLISRSDVIQFYPDAMGIFHSNIVYTFKTQFSSVIGDYSIKSNSFIYAVSEGKYAEFYKVDLNTGRHSLLERMEDTKVRSIAIDQRTGNIYYSSNFGIRILTESGRQGRFKNNIVSYDIGRIFINPFGYKLHAFQRHKHNNETMVVNYDMGLDEVGRNLFFYEPNDAFGVEATRDGDIVAGHIASKSGYRVIIESMKTFEEKKITLKTVPSHINPHGSQLFYTVDNRLISYDLNSDDSSEKVILKGSDSIDVLKIYSRDFKGIEMNACKFTSCSHVCVMLSEEATKCICPSFSFLRDKDNCENPGCDKDEYYCKSEQGNSCKKYSDQKGCNNQNNCIDDSDEYDCEYGFWKSSFCRTDTEYYCETAIFPKCERREDLCSGEHRPKCLNTIDENEICKNFKECKKNQFKCKNSKPLFAICKSTSTVCDGTPDCRDNSDEDGCTTNCLQGQFACKDQDDSKKTFQCVQNTTLCDGKNDCANGLDEDTSICESHCSKSDQFKCDYYGSTCVPSSLVCNGVPDCENGRDEQNCKECTDSEYKCSDYMDETICSKRCDGNKECYDGSDENDCDCDENEVTCNLKICIDHKDWCQNPNPKKCSRPRNIPDCSTTYNPITTPISTTNAATTSITVAATTTVATPPPAVAADDDITSTSSSPSTSQQTPTIQSESFESSVSTLLKNCSNDQEMLCKDKTKCIHIKLFCDYSPDCPDGSDEGGLCDDSSVCRSNRICKKGICYKLPRGKPICKCPQGYLQTESDCIDINECEDDNPCDQICDNLEGHYKCSCKPGYTIDHKTGTCTSSYLPTFWIGSYSKIYQYSETYDSSIKWQMKNENHLSAMAMTSKTVILSEVGKDSTSIYQFNKMYPDQNTTIMKFEDSEILGLAYDWINENIYYTEYKHYGNYNDKGTIGVCTIKEGETLCKTLFKGIGRFSKVVVDPLKGYIYWVEFQGRYNIRRADMDCSPSSIRTLFEPDIHSEPLLTVDYATHRVYSYYDGKAYSTDPEMPKKIWSRGLHLDAPKSMDFFENKIYFGAQEGLIEYSIRSNVQKTIYRLDEKVTFVLLSHKLRQPKDSNEHEKACYPACSPKEICLMNPKGGSCVQSDKTHTVTQQPTNSPDEFLTALLLVWFWERLKKWSRKPLKLCAGLTTMIFRRSEDERNLVENPGFIEDVHEIDEKDDDKYVEMSYNV
ncbi:DgyrCDS3004 [Dimorphilus gyrociliatus]|uniref:DgyrCDS3004 n=1 Tax=Dimorphilus gyrociliatus TaxID=2664684 RepID=A0A7I8VD50_9ANNE|nr:DgyrCDS3004 [Dimorphilus gyrociliatus]